MQKNFFEYFRPTKAETEALWRDADFIFDTNVLLNLYRMSAKTSGEMIEILKTIKDRLYLPHQVGIEFFRNLEEEIAKQVNAFESVKSRLRKIPADFSKELIRHPCIPISNIKAELEKCVNEQIEIVSQSQSDNQINFFLRDDPILSELIDLFGAPRVGNLSDDEDKEVNDNVEERIKDNKAPCYTSTSAKANPTTNPHRGDGRVWFQILKYARENKKPIIFITGDLNENWWRMVKLGNTPKPVGPHFELIRDISSITENKFWMYSQAEFLEKAPEYLGAREQTEGIEEIQHLTDARAQAESEEIPDEPKPQSQLQLQHLKITHPDSYVTEAAERHHHDGLSQQERFDSAPPECYEKIQAPDIEDEKK